MGIIRIIIAPLLMESFGNILKDIHDQKEQFQVLTNETLPFALSLYECLSSK